ncbi:helix-turn-helix domain-containing protein [Niabella insulamsoli]|uniref:helix-turn-helix domain-containing protein n=1 Tax=Niabella insulamsoli TaxID=3144874 RepID=UPI0031FD3640
MSNLQEFEAFTGKNAPFLSGVQEISSKEQHIPGAINYSFKRFVREADNSPEDIGLVNYHYQGDSSENNSINLRFCVAGNMYCAADSCQKCPSGNAKNCEQSTPCFDVVAVDFSAQHLSKYTSGKAATTGCDLLLRFNKKQSFQKSIPLCCKTRSVIEGLVNHKYTGSFANIYMNAQLQMLLLYSMDWVAEKEEILSCRFLNSDVDREKIALARDILIQNLGQPVTIKELSRKVAMNECYLKKGFKEMFGTTIFDFYQNQRMEHAKYLLYEKGMNVTDVSMMLGYSSISHFSTAFKKQTGLKPCELLLRN